MAERTVLVTGATGRQGGAVARHLMANPGWRVRALTRDPTSPSAVRLARRGAEVVKGDLDHVASLEAAMAGVHGVFSVQDPWLHGVEKEVEQGKSLAFVAAAAGVQHFVHGSVGSAERPTGVPHFESKGIIERHVDALGLPRTFIRPAFFMDSLMPEFERRAPQIWGALRRGLDGGSFQLVAVDDIGRLAAMAFAQPEVYVGQAIELAGDELTIDQARAIHLRLRGRRPRMVGVPFWIMGIVNREARINFEWIGREGWHFDLEALRRRFPWLQTWEAWLGSLPPAEEPR